MKYVVKTQQGQTIELGEKYDPEKYNEVLQAREIEAVAFGEISTLKRNIKSIEQVFEEDEEPTGTPLVVFLASAQEAVRMYAHEFNASELSAAVNRRDPFLRIGENFLNSAEYSMVVPEQ